MTGSRVFTSHDFNTSIEKRRKRERELGSTSRIQYRLLRFSRRGAYDPWLCPRRRSSSFFEGNIFGKIQRLRFYFIFILFYFSHVCFCFSEDIYLFTATTFVGSKMITASTTCYGVRNSGHWTSLNENATSAVITGFNRESYRNARPHPFERELLAFGRSGNNISSMAKSTGDSYRSVLGAKSRK